jgi:hypothetical protein
MKTNLGSIDPSSRNDCFLQKDPAAVERFPYSQQEGAQHTGLHYTTISRRLNSPRVSGIRRNGYLGLTLCHAMLFNRE